MAAWSALRTVIRSPMQVCCGHQVVKTQTFLLPSKSTGIGYKLSTTKAGPLHLAVQLAVSGRKPELRMAETAGAATKL